MKIKYNIPLAKSEVARRTWKLNRMKVTDVIDLRVQSAEEWRKASKYAHTFGDTKTPPWKFKTTKPRGSMVGRIRRIK